MEGNRSNMEARLARIEERQDHHYKNLESFFKSFERYVKAQEERNKLFFETRDLVLRLEAKALGIWIAVCTVAAGVAWATSVLVGRG